MIYHATYMSPQTVCIEAGSLKEAGERAQTLIRGSTGLADGDQKLAPFLLKVVQAPQTQAQEKVA